MVNLSISGDSIVFEFINSNYYLQNGKIATPINSLALITDESNIATFKKASSNDIFVAATYDELGKSKNELIEWFKDNAVGATGGGGDLDDYYTKEQTDALLDSSISGKADSSAVTEEISAAVSGKADTSAMTTALADKLDVSTFETYSGDVDTALSGKASQSDLNTLSGDITDVQTALQGKASQSDLTALESVVDTKASNADLQALESVVGGKLNTSDFNTYSANVNTELASKASNADLNTLSGVVDTKADKTEIPDVSNYIDNVDYDSANHLIKFFHNQTLIDSVDATDFIKDGMVSNVEIVNGKLVISFNTDAGKEDIEIPLTDIFNPNNYYDKTATDGLLDAKVYVTAYTAYTSSTETALNGKASQTDLETVSGDVATKLSTSDFNTYSGGVDTALQGKADTSDLANYVEVTAYTAYTSATDTALSGKASQTDLETVSGNVATVSGSVANKQDILVSGTNIKTINNTSILGSGDIEISGGGDVDPNLDINSENAVANSAITKTIQDNELVIANALINLQNDVDGKADASSVNGKLDVSAFTAYSASVDTAIASKASQTDLNTVSGATASNTTALGGYSLWKGTTAQYEAIVTKDNNTIYFVVD